MDENGEELITISGDVESVVFRNENNGWTVLEMDCGGELVTVTGAVFQVRSGERIKVIGRWMNHPNYGRQFKGESFERSLPSTTAAILKYLSGGAVRGIGPATAQRMVETFGVDALNILENEPARLTEIKGISPAKAAAMNESYRQQFGLRSLMLFLQQYGVTAAESIRIWKRWGVNALDMIKKNPYVLCGAGLWISFERVDGIAAEMGCPTDGEERIKAGIGHVLRQNMNNKGHTYIPREKLTDKAVDLLGTQRGGVNAQLDGMLESGELEQAMVRGGQGIFLPDTYRAETYIAGRLSLMLSITPPPLGSCEARITQAEQSSGIKYAGRQRQAIQEAYNKNLLILTGGPGTGKTTTLNAIISIYEGMGLKVALAAPTGRAAKRMAEVTGREAKTIHRLLEMEYSPDDDTPRFARGEKNPLDCDALIVDEMSMVDVMLFESLMRALKLTCRLVMVGDADQLPPVGSGNALRDMINSGTVPTVTLEEVFRQASESLIVTNAHSIVRGEMPELSCRTGDFFFLPCGGRKIFDIVTGLVRDRLPAAYGYSPMWDIQVLVPGRKGEFGTGSFNAALQQAMNPAAPGVRELSRGGTALREGDKIMQVKNNYDIVWKKDDGEQGAGIFNGDVGVLEKVDASGGSLRVRFEDRVAEYGPENIDELELAYAVTVHKSQGSEFEAVVLPLIDGAPQLMYRNLLYTAVTRARRIVIIVGQREAVGKMVANERRMKRYTGLRDFLENGVGA
jgi:exodeoxyribonuclease V alpha subunit